MSNIVQTAHEYDAIVLGAGISGLVATSVLMEQGCRRILVIDEYEHVGGNHINFNIKDYSFDIGSLIFQDDSPLLRHFPEILPKYVNISPSWGKLTPHGTIANYPLSIKEDVLTLGPIGFIRAGLSVLKSRLFNRHIGNARDFARYWIGDYFLYRSGLENYMQRFFGAAAARIDADFAEKRMLWLKEHSSPKAMLRYFRGKPSSGVDNYQLARPKSGFADLYAPAVEKLERAGVAFMLGTKVGRIESSASGNVVHAGNLTLKTSRVISTIPIPLAVESCGLPDTYGLETVTLISLFFSFSGERGFGHSILYNFSHDGHWKRLTVYSDFYGRSDGREYFAVEVIASDVVHDTETARADFCEHVRRNGLFVGDLVLEGSSRLDNAYPVYTNKAKSRALDAIAKLKELRIESFGRQGGFEYQPTARTSTLDVESAMKASPAV